MAKNSINVSVNLIEKEMTNHGPENCPTQGLPKRRNYRAH